MLLTGARMVPRVGPLKKVQENLAQRARECSRTFMALQPITLSIPRGQCVGIVGRNGSGKSTLLQLICGILQPSTGTARVGGRIAALLELGSGFNPEFTGRENVFLNASLLGVSRQQVEERFEEILDFADIGDFIEQPVKTYSSGMMLRLAFAVQVLMEPDILIVDEALAVGDEPFQRKCFARIEALRDRGVTVLFVSHDMSSVTSLCDRALFLHRGELLMDGSPKAVAAAYQRFNHAPVSRAASILEEIKSNAGKESGLDSEESAFSDAFAAAAEDDFLDDYDPRLEPESTVIYDKVGAEISNIRLVDENGRKVNVLNRRKFYRYCFTVEFQERCEGVNFTMLIKTLMGVDLGGARTYPADERIECVEAGSRWEVSFRFQCLLTPGCYCMNAGVEGLIDGQPSYAHRVIDALIFKVRHEQDLIPTVLVDFLIEPGCAEVQETPALVVEAAAVAG